LYRRSIPKGQLLTLELATVMTQLSREIKRQVGVIADRKGNIPYVVVGDSSSLFMPELGRLRAGKTRFRGVRLIHTHLKGEPITNDDLTDLSLLSFDYMVALDARPECNPLMMSGAYLLPVNPDHKQWEMVGPNPVHSFDLDFSDFIRELENEFSKKSEALAGYKGAERATLVYLDDGRSGDPDWEVEELRELALSAGLQVVDVVRQRRKPDRKYFVGRGRLFDIIVRTMQREVDLLVLCPDLSAAQVKSIGDITDLRVIDRTQLILDIFAQRAQSSDGKIQVELAQLRYLLPRLIGAGIAMSRLRGGIGMRGPGETKLETDRRRINQRIATLDKQLKKLAARRKERRKRRERNRVPIVAIVGYTNAGKSTLLNTLTKATAIAENKLFATLDPFSKRLRFPQDREIVLTDTVGFIKDLPKDLKAAFKATLEELESADVLLHMVDASSKRAEEQLDAVEGLLVELELAYIPRITVFNKMDLLENEQWAENLAGRYDGLAVSALSRESLRPLVERMESMLWDNVNAAVSVTPELGRSIE
jgi:GTPase